MIQANWQTTARPPRAAFFWKCLGPISRAQRLAIFGDAGRVMSRMDPGQQRRQRNRGAALWGNLVITGARLAPRIIATDRKPARWPGKPEA
jgi:hypothetical protein